MENKFTVKTAQQYEQQNNIKEWIREYLTNSDGPNVGLWDRIEERNGSWVGPIAVMTNSLVRCFPNDESRVSKLVQNIQDPHSVAPLIIHSRIHKHEESGPNPYTIFSHKLEIADGNHRHAAFERKHWATCWVLVELGTEYLE